MISLSHAARAVVAVALLAGLAAAGSQWGWGIERLGQYRDAQSGKGTKITRRLIIYRLDPVRQTTFRFTQPVRQARLITHPILVAGSASNSESWEYAVVAELLDGQDRVVARREIHSRTTLLRRDGTRRGPLRFYRDSTELVALSDEARIAATQPFSAIRITASKLSPDMVAIDARISERRPLLVSAAASAFARFSPDDQTRLAAPNAFPPELLTPAERSNIAINQWRPVGPTGIDGRDYRMRVLYEEDDNPESSDDLRFDPEDGE